MARAAERLLANFSFRVPAGMAPLVHSRMERMELKAAVEMLVVKASANSFYRATVLVVQLAYSLIVMLRRISMIPRLQRLRQQLLRLRCGRERMLS